MTMTTTTKERNELAPVCHVDGRVTYWSVYDQRWIRRARRIEDRELAAMTDAERSRVERHFARHADA